MGATSTTLRRTCPVCGHEAVQEPSPVYGRGFVRLRCLSVACGNATQSFRPPREPKRATSRPRRGQPAGGSPQRRYWMDRDERGAG